MEEKRVPLAQRVRPRTFEEFVGQEHIAKEGSLFRRAIEAGTLGSAIFFGPPGTGKSTLANIIANLDNGIFKKLNAVSSGVADVKKIIDEARKDKSLFSRQTYLLLDECIKQDSCMSFGNKSVNTIRVYTIIDTCGKAHVVQTILRVGVGDSVVDNYCSGGYIYPVDIKSGRVDNTGWGHGADYSGIMIHPGTDIKMLGYQIPYWNDVKRYSCSLAEHLPEVRCVGWDIVVADNPCHVDFIEGNHDAHSGMLAMDNKITYTQLKSLIYDK